jgi:hypothetical protein
MTAGARFSSASPEPLAGGEGANPEPAEPRLAFRNALARYQTARLESIVRQRGLDTESARPSTLAADLTAQLDSPAELTRLLAALGAGSRQALAIFALAEVSACPLAGLWLSLAALGAEPRSSILELLEHGLLALEGPYELVKVEEFPRWLEPAPDRSLLLRVHPAAAPAVRISRPEGKLEPISGTVGQIRESDGLDPVIHLAAVWQRVGIEPLRQTQQGTLYKRDMERIEEDPILSSTSTDALELLPALPMFWLALARRVGLIRADSSGERLEAAGPDFWLDNAVHLPQMIATSWLGLRSWHEWEPAPAEPADAGSALPDLRTPLLLWLATLEDDQWVALDVLAEHLEARDPQWDRLSLRSETEPGPAPTRRTASARGKSDAASARGSRGQRILRSLLLGAASRLGLVRAGEERESGRTVVQLTPLGKYVLAMGPPPPPRTTFEHFLFVQPNLEIVAYRQGLSPQLVGRLSQFAWWTKIGAAAELKLSQESVVLGLEGGLTPDGMIDLLARHSQRPLPSLVPDAIGRWASRRERISVYTAATLIEFGSGAERDQALAAWAENDPKAFVAVGEKFLLAEIPQRIPTDRISSKGSRDYRLPPEKCVSIEADGITLTLDLTRSDLLIDAELSRLADGAHDRTKGRGGFDAGVRTYVVSPASLGRAAELGLTSAQIADWFIRRTGQPPSPALKLLLQPVLAGPISLPARRTVVVITPTAELADGLLQHPATRDLLGDRLGPTAIIIANDHLEALSKVLTELGISLVVEGPQ